MTTDRAPDPVPPPPPESDLQVALALVTGDTPKAYARTNRYEWHQAALALHAENERLRAVLSEARADADAALRGEGPPDTALFIISSRASRALARPEPAS